MKSTRQPKEPLRRHRGSGRMTGAAVEEREDSEEIHALLFPPMSESLSILSTFRTTRFLKETVHSKVEIRSYLPNLR